MTTRKVAIVTGAAEGIGAGLVAGYRRRDWAVVASALTIKPSQDPDLLTVTADITEPATAGQIVDAALDGLGGWLPPLGRVGQISDVVDGVLFLESARYITGEILHIDGGQIAGHGAPLD